MKILLLFSNNLAYNNITYVIYFYVSIRLKYVLIKTVENSNLFLKYLFDILIKFSIYSM